jgi:hypothetical protein
MKHYVYAYLREDRTPYYIGKGTANRCKEKHNVGIPPDDRIEFIKTELSDQEAIQLEIELIAKYGRKDLGTGILRNMTDGGDGVAGRIFTEETRAKISSANKGKPSPMKGKKNPGLSAALKGKKQSPEHIAKLIKIRKGKPNPKLSLALKGRPAHNKGKPQERVMCPHCNKQGGLPQMKQWHFDKCKEKK